MCDPGEDGDRRLDNNHLTGTLPPSLASLTLLASLCGASPPSPHVRVPLFLTHAAPPQGSARQQHHGVHPAGAVVEHDGVAAAGRE